MTIDFFLGNIRSLVQHREFSHLIRIGFRWLAVPIVHALEIECFSWRSRVVIRLRDPQEPAEPDRHLPGRHLVVQETPHGAVIPCGLSTDKLGDAGADLDELLGTLVDHLVYQVHPPRLDVDAVAAFAFSSSHSETLALVCCAQGTRGLTVD